MLQDGSTASEKTQRGDDMQIAVGAYRRQTIDSNCRKPSGDDGRDGKAKHITRDKCIGRSGLLDPNYQRQKMYR